MRSELTPKTETGRWPPIAIPHSARLPAACALVAALTLFDTLSASAAMRMRIEDVALGVGVILTDNGPGDTSPLIGAIAFVGGIGGFALTVNVGTSKPLLGGSDYSELDLTSVAIKTTGAATLRVTLHDTGYTVPVQHALSLVGGTLSATAGSTATFQGWIDLANATPALGADVPVPGALPAIGAFPGTSMALLPGPGVVFVSPGIAFAFSATSPTTGFPLTTALYSLINQATMIFTGAGSVSFDHLTRAVPEPGMMTIFGLGLAALAGVRRRKT